MKVLSSLAVLVLSQEMAISVKNAEDLIAGVIYGLIQKDDLKYLETCLTDSDTVAEEVNEAVEDFMKGDIESIIKGVETIGTLLTQLPADLKDC